MEANDKNPTTPVDEPVEFAKFFNTQQDIDSDVVEKSMSDERGKTSRLRNL